jgi:imidazoleglycerol-phosphate dehydratase
VSRSAAAERKTSETEVRVSIDLDGTGTTTADTGIGFFDHMLAQLGRHSGFDIEVRATGDLEVDGHHTVEDVGLVLGSALSDALGDRAGIRRFGWASVPMDEALVEVSLDVSGRPYTVHEVELPPGSLGAFDPWLVEDFVRALAMSAGLTVHVRSRSGRSVHHVVEAECKALARALGDACARSGSDGVPSTKGRIGEAQ